MNHFQRMQNRSAIGLGTFIALVGFAAPQVSHAADDELHEVSWGQPAPDSDSVQSFILYISPERGAVELARQVNVGVPAGQALGGMLLYAPIVASGEKEFIAVSALGKNGLMSPLSAWGQVQPTQPVQLER